MWTRFVQRCEKIWNKAMNTLFRTKYITRGQMLPMRMPLHLAAAKCQPAPCVFSTSHAILCEMARWWFDRLWSLANASLAFNKFIRHSSKFNKEEMLFYARQTTTSKRATFILRATTRAGRKGTKRNSFQQRTFFGIRILRKTADDSVSQTIDGMCSECSHVLEVDIS